MRINGIWIINHFSLLIGGLIVLVLQEREDISSIVPGFVAAHWAMLVVERIRHGLMGALSSWNFLLFLAVGVFHLGIPLSLVLGGSEGYISNYIHTWYYSGGLIPAFSAVFLFNFGYSIFLGVNNESLGVAVDHVFGGSKLAKNFSILCLFIFIFLWILIVKVMYGIDSYLSYQQAQGSSLLIGFASSFLIVFISCSFIFSLTYRNMRRVALLLFALWVIPAFFLGLRGEVLFPLCIALPFLVRDGMIKVTIYKALLAVVISLYLMSYVFGNRSGEAVDGYIVSPVSAFSEIGSSLRPVYEVLEWRENGDRLHFGATYWAPFERTLKTIMPFVDPVPALEDGRLMNVVIAERSGPYGFSVVAEAVVNFGIFGAFFMGALISYVIRLIDRQLWVRGGWISTALMVGVLYGAFFHVRQSFVGAFGGTAVSFMFGLLFFYLKFKDGSRFKNGVENAG